MTVITKTAAGPWRRVAAGPLLHPFLFAIYPVVFLWAQNLHVAPPAGVALALMAIMVGGVTVVTVLSYALLRDARRAAFVASAIVGSFTAYGRVAQQLGISPTDARNTWLLIGWLAGTLVLVGIACSVRARGPGLTMLLNTIAGVLVLANLIPIVAHTAQGGGGPTAAWTLDPSTLDPAFSGPERDVYYLIFDRYAGEGILRDLYGFDDSAFFDGLESRGFTVVRDAVANYPQTTHSLASSLNMTYLDDLSAEVGETSSDWGPLQASLRDTTVSRTLQALGYTYVHLGSWWAPTWEDPAADVNYVYGGLSEFSGTYWNTTMLQTIEHGLHVDVAPDDRLVQFHRVGFQVDKIAETAKDPEPTFTFAHFTLPHTPYVFHADGSLTDDAYRPPEEAYIDQLKYTNVVIDRVIDEILASPGPDPIIVVQSDEGPHPPAYDYGYIRFPWPQQPDVELDRKLHILEAFYLPDLEDRSAFEGITPVNTFRLIFDDYFRADLPALPDRTYAFVDYEHPYRFVDITDRLR